MKFRRNVLIMLVMDAGLSLLCFYLAFLIRFDFNIPHPHIDVFYNIWPWVLAIKLACYWFFGLYRGVWRYTSLMELINVLKAVMVSAMIIVVLGIMLHGFQDYPRTVFIMDPILTFVAISGLRVAVRVYYTGGAGLILWPFHKMVNAGGRRLLIIGAGTAGEKVLREIQENPDMRFHVIGFLDDARDQGSIIHGVPILGPTDDIRFMAQEFDEALIAMPNARGNEMRRLVRLLEETGKPFRTIPSMNELIDGRVTLKAVRNVTVADMLGREELSLNQGEIARYLEGRRILVTGAGGSIGSELVRQIGKFKPEAIGFLETNEFNLFSLEAEFRQYFPDLLGRPFLADVRNPRAVAHVMDEFRPHVVFHAAAYKHVPMQESYPWEAVATNVGGTRTVALASIKAGVDRFVFVSTDKAVRPTNIMGATKRVAEMLIECLDSIDATRFMAVRFGNVMGSSGSAIPVFRKQIARGGPVTVTHPEVTRYFMSVGEAAQLILQAGAIGEGGEIFILEMGKPVRILDLAKDMIRLHGFEPGKDIPIEFIGLRPGEKLYEELITEGENIVPTGRKKIMVLKGSVCGLATLDEWIDDLLTAAGTFDPRVIKAKLHEIVPEYTETTENEHVAA